MCASLRSTVISVRPRISRPCWASSRARTIESSARRREPTANIGEDDMARKRDKRSDDSKRQADKALNRRDFFRGGAAAGVGATVLSTSAMAQENGAQGIRWNYEADVVILGAGC